MTIDGTIQLCILVLSVLGVWGRMEHRFTKLEFQLAEYMKRLEVLERQVQHIRHNR